MLKDKIKYEIKRHFSDSTAIITMFFPLYSFYETFIVGMSNAVSFDSRLWNTGSIYAGIGSFTKLRDFSKEKLFKIKKSTKEILKYAHDSLFAATLILGLKPVIYLVSGETDWRKIVLGTFGSVGLGSILTGPAGHLVDIYRDLTGVKESERTPRILQRQPPRIKKIIAAAALTTSLALGGLVYYINPTPEGRGYKKPKIQQTEKIALMDKDVLEEIVLNK
jgi:hypothetical protein